MKDEDYNPTSHTLTILMVLAVCVAVILMLLASCRTIHDTERVYTHDTLIVHHTDTFVHTKTLHVHDTTRQVENHYITLNDRGDTIKELHYYHDKQWVLVVDSTDRYKAKNDSLQRLLNKEREREKVVEKKEPWKYRLALYAALCALVLLSWYSFKGKIKDTLRR